MGLQKPSNPVPGAPPHVWVSSEASPSEVSTEVPTGWGLSILESARTISHANRNSNPLKMLKTNEQIIE